MSIIFQLFSAEDLKQLTDGQYDELRKVVVEAVENSNDTALKASLTIALHIQSKHLPTPQGVYTTINPALQNPAASIDIKNEDIDHFPESAKAVLRNVLRKRINVVFQQLTGRLPTDSSSLPASEIPTIDEFLDAADMVALKNRVGDHGRRILESALTCELANLKTYEALKDVKQQAEAEFIRLTGGQRPKGPDLIYSPFYPRHPLYSTRPGEYS